MKQETLGQAVIKFMETQEGTIGAANAFRKGAEWQISRSQPNKELLEALEECLSYFNSGEKAEAEEMLSFKIESLLKLQTNK